MADVCVVVPMLNESTTIADVVVSLRHTFPHVLCVDDGSTDGSAAIAAAAGAEVLRHATNLGQGAALQTGFDHAARTPAFRWVVTFDADGQHLVRDAEAMVAAGRAQDLDVVLASRFTGETVDMPRARRMVLRGAIHFTRWTAGLQVTDAHNGLRVINTRALDLIRLRQPRMAYASELLHQIGAGGLRWAEVPTTVLYSEYSRAKGQRNINAVNIVFDLLMARVRTHP
ncbi:glycosyltransferase family 2 protein [Marmoricola sp. RAF53]|uniref:glycosyltransferase family 2 protein n=1 Tax=Marmoricola sp. RAF53 TaxID=3233059 RepID=UPI003F9A12D8